MGHRWSNITRESSTGARGRAIAQGSPTQIDLSPSPVGGFDEAAPSALAADGQSFNDCTYTTSCTAP